jgi:hypothetical protein
MHITHSFQLGLAGAILGLVMLACASDASIPTPTGTPLPTIPPQPTLAPTLASTPTDASTATLLPELAGYWQSGNVVFTIEKNNDQYAVTALNAAGPGTRTLTHQAWDGSRLTWTYQYAEALGGWSVTFSTKTLIGNSLLADYSTSDGESAVRTLRKVSSAKPSYDSLPYQDDFSVPGSGWDSYNAKSDSAGYQNGAYFVISRTNRFTSYGEPNLFYGDTVIAVDATPVNGPANSNFSYHIGCRIQTNGDGYLFEVRADGYFKVDYYSGGGVTQTSLSGKQWKKSAAIQPGMATNHLTVTCAGSELKLDVNGQVLYDGQDSTFTEGDIDLGAGTYDNTTPAEIHFTHLVVTAP